MIHFQAVTDEVTNVRAINLANICNLSRRNQFSLRVEHPLQVVLSIQVVQNSTHAGQCFPVLPTEASCFHTQKNPNYEIFSPNYEVSFHLIKLDGRHAQHLGTWVTVHASRIL